jgi:hypothetical protein
MTVTMPELFLVAGTRVLLGAGIGLVVGSKLGSPASRRIGKMLFALGALSTIPIARKIRAKEKDVLSLQS